MNNPGEKSGVWFSCREASFGYGGRIILDNLTTDIPLGMSVGLVGPNGAGKTTLLKAMLGVLKPLSGSLVHASFPRSRIGYVPQRGDLDELFPFTLEEIVEMGLYGEKSSWFGLGKIGKSSIRAALEAVGLLELAESPFRALSGGQKQRGLLARALVREPDTLILDEPTRGLDLAQSHSLLELLNRYHRERGLTMVLVSHILPEVMSCTKQILLLHQGKMAFHGPVAELSDATLSRIYGVPVSIPRTRSERPSPNGNDSGMADIPCSQEESHANLSH
ncbi:MAG: ATP-binding cassette domain-containing protein [Candidatus Ozemobacteraceae bacterium]